MAYQNLFEQLQETCDFIALEDDMNQIINALEKDLIEQGQTLPLVDVSNQRELLIAYAKWTTTMDEMFIESAEEYVDAFINEGNL